MLERSHYFYLFIFYTHETKSKKYCLIVFIYRQVGDIIEP